MVGSGACVAVGLGVSVGLGVGVASPPHATSRPKSQAPTVNEAFTGEVAISFPVL